MPVLFIDTALDAASVAVADGETTLFARTVETERGHQEHLAGLVRDALTAAALAPRDIDRVGVVVGPGSFTGLRIGIAFAKGFAFGVRAPCVGVTTLEALALSLPGEGSGAVLMEGGRGEIFLQEFERGAALGAPEVLRREDLATRLRALPPGAPLVGSAAPRLGADVDDHGRRPDPAAGARAVGRRAPPFPPPKPVYLRPPDARTLEERTVR